MKLEQSSRKDSPLRLWRRSLARLFFQPCCAVCGIPLVEGEEAVCTACNMDLPRTGYHWDKDNPVARLFWGKVPLERAMSLFFYRKGGGFRDVLHRLKYGGRKDLAVAMGRLMARELAGSGFFDAVNVLVPVPLHPLKRRERGYNQSECLARGVSAVTGIPLDASSLERIRHNPTQTHLSGGERWDNVEGIFSLRDAGQFRGKHVLLVDDVLTTGSTLTACADALSGVEGIRISVLSLAVAAL